MKIALVGNGRTGNKLHEVIDGSDQIVAVSYTHLTLPTSDLVQISVVAVSLKKKKKEKQEAEHNVIKQRKVEITSSKLYKH